MLGGSEGGRRGRREQHGRGKGRREKQGRKGRVCVERSVQCALDASGLEEVAAVLTVGCYLSLREKV